VTARGRTLTKEEKMKGKLKKLMIAGVIALAAPMNIEAQVIDEPPPSPTDSVGAAFLYLYNEQVIYAARSQAKNYAYVLGHADLLRAFGYETCPRNEDILSGLYAGDWQRKFSYDLDTMYRYAAAGARFVNQNQPVIDDCFNAVAAAEADLLTKLSKKRK